MVGRFFASTSKHLFMTSKHSGLNFFEIFEFILNFPDLMTYIVSEGVAPLNGKSPDSIAKRMMPVAQTSILPSTLYYFVLIKHSGAIYARLPASRSSQVRDLMAPAIPKSIILISFLSLFTNNMF